MMKKERIFITKSSKKNVILMLVILVAACIILAIISLIPNRAVSDWLNNDAGVSRGEMFPFVFTSDNALYIMNEDLKVSEIDDSVVDCVHDVKFNLVYYLRDDILYEYDIGSNKRIAITEGVTDYLLFEERTAILCRNSSNDIHLYSYKDKDSKKLNKSKLNDIKIEYSLITGQEHILFLDNFSDDFETADLKIASLDGEIKTLAENIDALKKFNISEEDDYISFYKGDKLVIVDTDGKEYTSLKNARLILQTTQPVLTTSTVNIMSYSDKIDFDYFLSDISDTGNKGKLIYFDGKKQTTVDSNIRSIVHHEDEDSFVIYTKDSGDGDVTVYKSVKGKEPDKLVTCNSSDNLFFDSNLNFLYIQSSDGLLKRINVNDKKRKVTDVSEKTGVLFDYTNKSFIAYHDAEGKYQYLVLDTNSIERYPLNEIRLYGKYNDRYLLCREYQQGIMSLDYASDGYLTRISGNVSKNVYFDKEFKNIIYCTSDSMYLWNDNESTKIGDYTNISAIAMIA